MVKFLVEKGADVRAGNDFAIRMASFNGHLKTVKFLVANGADVRAENDYAVRMASGNGNLEMVKFLVEKGARRDFLSEREKRYISFCERILEKRKIEAANKIAIWWIPLCYDLNRECGQRMMEKIWKRIENTV
jgi:hypothetical protein